MAVLAALEAIDFVVPFSEDTPERVIEAPGARCAWSRAAITAWSRLRGTSRCFERGGEVRIIRFFAGHSQPV